MFAGVCVSIGGFVDPLMWASLRDSFQDSWRSGSRPFCEIRPSRSTSIRADSAKLTLKLIIRGILGDSLRSSALFHVMDTKTVDQTNKPFEADKKPTLSTLLTSISELEVVRNSFDRLLEVVATYRLQSTTKSNQSISSFAPTIT